MDTAELVRKKRLAHKAITDFVSIEAEILGTPYFKAEIINSQGDSFDVLIETRTRFPKRVA